MHVREYLYLFKHFKQWHTVLAQQAVFHVRVCVCVSLSNTGSQAVARGVGTASGLARTIFQTTTCLRKVAQLSTGSIQAFWKAVQAS